MDVLAELSTKLAGKDTKDTEATQIKFKAELINGTFYGYGLMRIARGRAFLRHMKNIEPLLRQYYQAAPNPTAESLPWPTESAELDSDNDEFVELQEIPDEDVPTGGLLAKSCKEWSGLTVVHFDASELVANCRNEELYRYTDISIKILFPSPTSNCLKMSFEELLADPNLFPRAAFDNQCGVSNSELWTFLSKKSLMANIVAETYKYSASASSRWADGEYLKANADLTRLGSLYPACIPCIAPIILKVNKLLCAHKNKNKPRTTYSKSKNSWSATILAQPDCAILLSTHVDPNSEADALLSQEDMAQDMVRTIKDVSNDLLRICLEFPCPSNSKKFYVNLGKPNHRFRGRVHCESVWLACLTTSLRTLIFMAQ